jgi:hypothetical protein
MEAVMKAFWLSVAVALIMVSPAAVAFQETKVEDAVAKERAEKQKRLQEINKVQDDVQKKELLEKFIQENTDRVVLEPAYTSLLRTFRNLDPNKTIELADQILAKQLPARNTLRKNAYMYKLAAYQKQKNEEAINAVGLQILKTETDPVLLHESADIYKAGAAKLYEKAVAERQRLNEPDLYPSLSHLHVDLANELSRLGQHDRALESMSRATELTQKEIADIEALPEKDLKRNGLENLRGELGRNYQSMARILAETADAGRGLDYLVKAEGFLDPGAMDERSVIEETRGRVYEKMGNTEKSLDSYVRSVAFRMNPKIMDKIKSMAGKTGKPANAYFAEARRVREAAAQPFKPFELKTVEGETRSFQNVKNKVTLVNFFFPT